MENIIDKHILVYMALVYNYIANDEKSLSERKVSFFAENVIKKLRDAGIYCEISEEDISGYGYYDYGIEVAENNREYVLKKLRGWLYDFLPQEVITASLQKDVLSTIGVVKEQLQIQTRYTSKSGVQDIYALEGRRARESTREILEEKGCKDIEIGLAIPDQLDGDKGYHVSYRCKEPHERVNVYVKELNN